jgi:hypothetical protein
MISLNLDFQSAKAHYHSTNGQEDYTAYRHTKDRDYIIAVMVYV